MADIQLRAPQANDVDRARELLAAEGLPTADLTLERLAIVAEAGGELVGFIGLEAFEELGLLRSLLVVKSARGTGLGEQLVDALEVRAGESGIRTLWLLTIDADGWFEKHGYVRQERSLAPPAIQATEEFSSLCPGDAVVMKKDL